MGNGGDHDPIAVGALSVMVVNGGVASVADVEIADGVGNLSELPSLAVLNTFFSLIASLHFPDPSDTIPLPLLESDVLAFVLCATGPSPSSSPFSSRASRPFDLSIAPLSFLEAMVCPDALVWRAVMDHERQSLLDMGAYEEADLPPGEKAVGLKWIYDYKTDALGVTILGKEKASWWLKDFLSALGNMAKHMLLLLKWQASVFFLHGLWFITSRFSNLIAKPLSFMLNFIMICILIHFLALILLVLQRFFVFL